MVPMGAPMPTPGVDVKKIAIRSDQGSLDPTVRMRTDHRRWRRLIVTRKGHVLVASKIMGDIEVEILGDAGCELVSPCFAVAVSGPGYAWWISCLGSQPIKQCRSHLHLRFEIVIQVLVARSHAVISTSLCPNDRCYSNREFGFNGAERNRGIGRRK